ncbi:MAG: hypothetical protein ACPGLV_00925 [Bacteroidia bacterium]
MELAVQNMIIKQFKWAFYVLLVGNILSCEIQQSTKSITLSTVTSTDTVMAGTPKGMHLYFTKNQAVVPSDLLAEKGYSTDKLVDLSVDEIRIKVEVPETNFNPKSIEGFNTSFTKLGKVNTVIESEELAFDNRTYIIKVQDGLSTIDDLSGEFSLNGGLKLSEALQQNVVLTTQVFLKAKVRD